MKYIMIRNGDYYTFIHRQVPSGVDSGEASWQPFVQPTLTSNGTIGGDSFAVGSSSAYQVELAWRAFDGNNGTQWSSYNEVPARLRWYNPKPLRVSKITITNRNGVGSIIKDYDIQYADKGDDTDWVTLQSGTNTNTEYSGQWDIIVTHEEAHKHWRIIAKNTHAVGWAGTVSVANCAITGTVLMGLKTFNQPDLTANGTWGGDAFACKASSVWSEAFDAWQASNTGSSYWNPKSGTNHPHELYFYNPKPLKISRLGIRTRSNGNSAIKNFEVYASNDDLDYKLIKSDTSNITAGSTDYWCTIPEDAGAYKYWKIKSLSGQGSAATYWVCSYLSIEAKEVVEYSEIEPAPTFVQPPLTANGTLGGDSFAVLGSSYASNSNALCKEAFGAFDKNTSTYWRASSTNEHIIFYNPKPLKVKSLVITPFYQAITSVTVEGSNTNGDWVQLATMAPNTVNGFTVNVNSNAYYKYQRVLFRVASGNVHVAEITINADDNEVIERSYCVKYPVFLHPELSANGSMGGNRFAVESSSYGANQLPECLPAYGAFDGNDSTYWRAGSNEAWITFYNSTPIKLKSLTVSPYYAPVASVNIEGSNTNDGWVFVGASAPNTVEKFKVDVGSNTAYKYHRVKFVVSRDVVHVLDMKIEASV